MCRPAMRPWSRILHWNIFASMFQKLYPCLYCSPWFIQLHRLSTPVRYAIVPEVGFFGPYYHTRLDTHGHNIISRANAHNMSSFLAYTLMPHLKHSIFQDALNTVKSDCQRHALNLLKIRDY